MPYSIPTINSLAFVAYSGARIVLDRFYVTGQPSDAAFPAIAGAGIRSIVCVREPGEAPPSPPVPAPPPFDLAHERALAEKNGLTFTDIVITRTMTQPEFDVAATEAAFALARNAHHASALVHCSTGTALRRSSPRCSSCSGRRTSKRPISRRTSCCSPAPRFSRS